MFGYEATPDPDLLAIYEQHYADKSEAYCRSQLGHVRRLARPSNAARYAEGCAIQARLRALDDERRANAHSGYLTADGRFIPKD